MSAYDRWLTSPLDDMDREDARREALADEAADTECACGEMGTEIVDGEVSDFCETCHKACKGCGEEDVEKSWRGRCECCRQYQRRGAKARRVDAAYPWRRTRKRMSIQKEGKPC